MEDSGPLVTWPRRIDKRKKKHWFWYISSQNLYIELKTQQKDAQYWFGFFIGSYVVFFWFWVLMSSWMQHSESAIKMADPCTLWWVWDTSFRPANFKCWTQLHITDRNLGHRRWGRRFEFSAQLHKRRGMEQHFEHLIRSIMWIN